MNAQEVFDTVVAHLRKQGCQAMLEEENTCAYRNAAGEKCAAGCLILDEEYDPKMEMKSVPEILNMCPSLKERLGEHEGLICSLQRIHDGGRSIFVWENLLKDLAEKYNLVYRNPKGSK